MIVCSNCKNHEPTGALFCSECGIQLVKTQVPTTQKIELESDDMGAGPVSGQSSSRPSDHWISLHLVDSGQIIQISDRADFSLGRISDKQPIMPDIDLTPYQAFDHGVSRLHAVIRRADNQAVVMDLGSSNGSYLNGARLIANVESPLAQGDLLALGKLKIQIFLNLV